mmetsp:Transcript_11055/g.33148  ORF Transcript_11055/g.33148 Transcript_11055/m.33148 type:complete len:236 (+) Transcript_11055:92-799(+)
MTRRDSRPPPLGGGVVEEGVLLAVLSGLLGGSRFPRDDGVVVVGVLVVGVVVVPLGGFGGVEEVVVAGPGVRGQVLVVVFFCHLGKSGTSFVQETLVVLGVGVVDGGGGFALDVLGGGDFFAVGGGAFGGVARGLVAGALVLGDGVEERDDGAGRGLAQRALRIQVCGLRGLDLHRLLRVPLLPAPLQVARFLRALFEGLHHRRLPLRQHRVLARDVPRQNPGHRLTHPRSWLGP